METKTVVTKNQHKLEKDAKGDPKAFQKVEKVKPRKKLKGMTLLQVWLIMKGKGENAEFDSYNGQIRESA